MALSTTLFRVGNIVTSTCTDQNLSANWKFPASYSLKVENMGLYELRPEAAAKCFHLLLTVSLSCSFVIKKKKDSLCEAVGIWNG